MSGSEKIWTTMKVNAHASVTFFDPTDRLLHQGLIMGKGPSTPSGREPKHQPFVSLSYPTLSLFCFFSTKLIAEDVDSKPNGQIRFSIVGGDRDNEFAVDPILGLVKVKKKLDRERVSKFR